MVQCIRIFVGLAIVLSLLIVPFTLAAETKEIIPQMVPTTMSKLHYLPLSLACPDVWIIVLKFLSFKEFCSLMWVCTFFPDLFESRLDMISAYSLQSGYLHVELNTVLNAGANFVNDPDHEEEVILPIVRNLWTFFKMLLFSRMYPKIRANADMRCDLFTFIYNHLPLPYYGRMTMCATIELVDANANDYLQEIHKILRLSTVEERWNALVKKHLEYTKTDDVCPIRPLLIPTKEFINYFKKEDPSETLPEDINPN